MYGVQLEGTGSTILLDLRSSTKSNPHLNSGAGAVVNYDLITGTYERIECNLNADVRDLAFSPSVKNAIQDSEIQANTNFYSAIRYFSNKEVSKYIKEIYIPSDVLSKAQVESVDNIIIHNGSDDIVGVSLKNGNTILLSITAVTSKRSGFILLNGCCIVFDYTGLTGNATLQTTLNASVQDINCSPTIAGRLLDFDVNVKFTAIPETNKFLQQVYIPSNAIADLSTIVRIRVYNGFGGFYGLQLQATGGTILLSLRGTNKKAFYTDGTSGVVINWDYFDGGDYVEYDTSINGNAREMAYSPYIKAYMLNEQMNKVVTLFTDDDFLNSVIKELYIPSSVLSDAQVNSIDNYVLFRNGSLWGIVFKSSSSFVLELYSSQNLGSSIYARNGAYARYNLPTDGTSNLTGNAHLVLSKVRGVENSPAIYSYLLNEPNKIPKPWYENSQIVQDLSALNNQRAVVYQGDTKSDSNYVVNAVAYPDGSMIVCRMGGVVAKVATDGTETTLLTISHASDWRLCWMDKDLNVYVSPHSSVDNGGSNIDVSARGLYKLEYGESTFTKVISLYDPDSEVTTETENNDDTIWTMCQDSEGNLYAGVYAHTIRANAGIYKSTDGGDTWTYIYNFVTSGDAPSGRHIHDIICNPYDNCLYVIVGEINQIFKSADGGSTWTKTNWILEKYKGTMLFPVPDGILAGSDGAYECIMSKIYSDGRVRTTSKTWAGTVFAFRKSDVSGAIYAFTKIDSSVGSTDYFPPVAAISDPSALQDWLDENHSGKASWQDYNAFIAPRFPEDAIRPQHCAIYVSYDDGETWSIFKRFNVTSAGAFGFWTTGQFRNGECLTGYVGSSYAFVRPLVITEGKHKFGSSGLDLGGDIFVKLNSSSVVAQL